MSKVVSTNPSTYKPVGEVDVSTLDDIQAKVEAAHAAKKAWRELGVAGRVELLRKVSAKFAENKERFAKLEAKEMGMPIKEALEDFDFGLDYLNSYLDTGEEHLKSVVTLDDDKERHEVFKEPYGVVACIVPWNFPFANWVWQCGQNLVAGNTIVFKHSEETQLCGKLVEDVVNSVLPDGVFNEVYGDGSVGEQLVNQDVNLVCFTGSSATGVKIRQAVASRLLPTCLELGGSAPGIIFEDAEIEVRNYKKALDHIDKRKTSGKPIELKDILTIHELIMKGLLPPEKTGVLRSVGVDIIDQDDTVLYKGPGTTILKEEITALLEWLKASENVHPIIAAAILHFQFVSIHPFSDGNGRTTRVLTQLYLGLRDYDFRGTLVLDSYYYTDRREYYSALHTVQGENYQSAAVAVLDSWITYFTQGFLSAAKVLSVEVMILSSVIASNKPVKRINPEDADLLSYAKQFGSISLAEAESVLPNVPRRTLQRKLKTLVDNGYLTVSGSTRSTMYVWAKK